MNRYYLLYIGQGHHRENQHGFGALSVQIWAYLQRFNLEEASLSPVEMCCKAAWEAEVGGAETLMPRVAHHWSGPNTALSRWDVPRMSSEGQVQGQSPQAAAPRALRPAQAHLSGADRPWRRARGRGGAFTCDSEGGRADSLAQRVLSHCLVLAAVLGGDAGDDQGAHAQRVGAVHSRVSCQALVVLEPGDVGLGPAAHGTAHAALTAGRQHVRPEAHQEPGLLAQVGVPIAGSFHREPICGETRHETGGSEGDRLAGPPLAERPGGTRHFLAFLHIWALRLHSLCHLFL